MTNVLKVLILAEKILTGMMYIQEAHWILRHNILLRIRKNASDVFAIRLRSAVRQRQF